MPTDQKCYSINGEDFNLQEFYDVLNALDCEGRLEDGAIYYEADADPLNPSSFFRAKQIIDNATDALYDECGNAADGAFNCNTEAVEELETLLSAWAEKNFSDFRYWRVVNVVEKKVSADEVREYLDD